PLPAVVSPLSDGSTSAVVGAVVSPPPAAGVVGTVDTVSAVPSLPAHAATTRLSTAMRASHRRVRPPPFDVTCPPPVQRPMGQTEAREGSCSDASGGSPQFWGTAPDIRGRSTPAERLQIG